MAWENLPQPLADFLSASWDGITTHAIPAATAIFGTIFGSAITLARFRADERHRHKEEVSRDAERARLEHLDRVNEHNAQTESMTHRMGVLMEGYEAHVSALSSELSALREEACKLREEVHKLRKLLDHRTEICKGCHHFEYVFGVNNAPQ